MRTQLNPYEPDTMVLDTSFGRRVIAVAAGVRERSRAGDRARCVLHDRLTVLLGDRPQRVRNGLDALFEALLGFARPRTRCDPSTAVRQPRCWRGSPAASCRAATTRSISCPPAQPSVTLSICLSRPARYRHEIQRSQDSSAGSTFLAGPREPRRTEDIRALVIDDDALSAVCSWLLLLAPDERVRSRLGRIRIELQTDSGDQRLRLTEVLARQVRDRPGPARPGERDGHLGPAVRSIHGGRRRHHNEGARGGRRRAGLEPQRRSPITDADRGPALDAGRGRLTLRLPAPAGASPPVGKRLS